MRTPTPAPAMPAIPLTKGHFALVDEADFASLSRFRWHALETRHHVYASRTERTSAGKRRVYMHRQILGAPRGVVVDHRNRDTLDNRRANLRTCSRAENAMNSVLSAPRASEFRGVRRNGGARRHPWQAGIVVAGQYVHIGCYATELEAAMAYDGAVLRLYPEFARPNFTGYSLAKVSQYRADSSDFTRTALREEQDTWRELGIGRAEDVP